MRIGRPRYCTGDGFMVCVCVYVRAPTLVSVRSSNGIVLFNTAMSRLNYIRVSAIKRKEIDLTVSRGTLVLSFRISERYRFLDFRRSSVVGVQSRYRKRTAKLPIVTSWNADTRIYNTLYPARLAEV